MTKDTTLVVGGGLTGLAAAVGAAQRGERVIVVERGKELGGRGRSDTEGGYALNLGPHALYPRAHQLLGELGVEAEGKIPSTEALAMRMGGRVVPLPTGALSVLGHPSLSLAGKWALGRCLGQVLYGRRDARLDALSVREWLAGAPADARAVTEAFVRLATYSHAPERLSAGVAIRQIAGGLAVRYLDGGWQQIVGALSERARQLGVEVRLRAKVEAIEHEGGRVRAVIVDGERIACGAVIVTLSPKASVSLLGEAAPAELRRFAESATPVRAACLDVALRSLPRPAPKLVLGVDRPTYLSVHSSTARLAPEGGAVIHVARYLAPDERVDPAAARAELEAELDDVQPGWREVLVRASFAPALLVSHALAESTQRGLAGRPAVDATGVAGVALAADWVGPRGLLFEACLESARAAVASIATAARAAA